LCYSWAELEGSMRSIGVSFALSLVSIACGGSGLGTPVAVFPTKGDLEEVMSGDVKAVAPMKTVEVPSWRIETPIPAVGSAYPAENAWDRLLAGYVTEKGRGKLSSELRCAALETARFYVTAGGFPDDGTRQYIAERCGSTNPALRFGSMTGEAPADVADAAIATQYEPSVREYLEKSGLRQTTEVALGVARAGTRVGVVFYTANPVARLSRFSPLISGESVTLEGVVSVESDFALALVNQGTTGVRSCEPDRTLKLPQFRVSCPLLATDEQTRVEVATRKPGRVLMDIELSASVRRSEEAGLVYTPQSPTSTAVAADALAFQTVLFGALNDVRASAGVGPLMLEGKQSQVNERLAPHFFEASLTGQEETLDRIGLGVLAGWDVNGLIRDGGVYWGVVTSTRSPARFLAYALASPLGRSILLDPEMTRVAIGASGVAPSGAMALVTTYSFFQSRDHSADESKVFAELAKRRQARGHTPPHRVQRERALDRALARVASNDATTGEALEFAMQEISAGEAVGVSGWVAETADLRQIPWSDALLEREPLDVEVGVTHYKAPGGAWGQYAILVLIREPDGGRTASTGARSKL
jgi:hypothetical protein